MNTGRYWHISPILTLALCAAPALATDDHGDSCGAATAVATDGTVVGAIIDPSTDEDWISFSAVAGNRYQATTLAGSAAFYYIAQVIGPDCSTVLAEWSYGSPDELSIIAAVSGAHYVRIASIDGAYVGYLELGLTDQGPATDDFSGSRAAASPIPSDGTIVAGETNYVGDVDWLTFSATGQRLYQLDIRAQTTDHTWFIAADFYRDGYGLASTGWSSVNAGDPPAAWATARYYVPAGMDGNLLVRVGGYPGLTGPYEVRVTDLGAPIGDDHGNDCGSATAVATDGSVTDVFIDPETDEDWLTFFAEAGNLYSLTTFTPSGQFFPMVNLISDDCGTVLGEWGPPNQAELSFFPPVTGTYYLRCTSSSGAYAGYLALGITDRGPQADDHSGSQAGATPAPTDGTLLNGSINYAGDYDYFTFNALDDHLYSVQVRALTHTDYWSVANTLFQGAYQLDFSDWSYGGPEGPGLWSGVVYGVSSGAGGAYYVLVYGGSADAGGSYELTITDLGVTPVDDHGDDAPSATPIPTDGTILSGVIGHGGDTDWFRYTTVEQRVYAIEVKALDSPDSGLAGGSLYSTDGMTSFGFTGWSNGGPGYDGDWARAFYYVPADAQGDYYVSVLGYSFTAGQYQVRVILGPGLPGDFDNDNIPDATDNCPTVFNPDQTDTDEDGIGDCCDSDAPDADGDGVADSCDNCPSVYNPGQLDDDNDGIGNECEQAPCPGDIDGDGFVNQSDLGILLAAFNSCPGDPNYNEPAGLLGGDECVTQADLGVLLANFGTECP